MKKKKVPGYDFLEQHTKMQEMKQIDDNHVIVDKKDWERVIDHMLIYPLPTDTIKQKMFKFSTVDIEPIHLCLFEVDIVTPLLTDDEKCIFREQILSVNETSMEFNQYELGGKIQPLSVLTKLIGSGFDLNIKVHSREGTVLGVYTFQGVYLDGFHCMNFDFSYESQEIMPTMSVWIKVSAIKFNNVKIL